MPTPPSRDTLDGNDADFGRGVVTRDGFRALCSAEHYDHAASIGACSASLARLADALERGPLQLFEPDGAGCSASDLDGLRRWAARHFPIALAHLERERWRGRPPASAPRRGEPDVHGAAPVPDDTHAGTVACLAQAIAAASDTAALPPLFAAFDAEADRLPWRDDRDDGALALQAAAAEAGASAVRDAMLAHALERARRCAAGATAGSEGIARAVHVAELERLRGPHR
jgi:hypothetical protein